jgi:selenocysteine-specific elongation factor
MPQTREHLAILELLGARRGLVALTKVDLVEPDLLELARQDVQQMLRGSFLDGAPLLAVSGQTGEGLAELRAALDGLLSGVPPRDDSGPFRLPVQRVFSAKGHGTVVTGVPVSGRVAAGDVLEVVGRDLNLRVRGVQAYGAAREVGRAGHSTALNVSGVAKSEVSRGDVVASPGVFAARRRLAVSYAHVDELPLRNRLAVRLHLGTAEVQAFLQLRLADPVVAAPGDRYLLRHASAMTLLGGGSVVGASDARLKRFKERVLAEARQRLAAQDDPLRLARTVISISGRRGCRLAELAPETGVPAEWLREGLAEAVGSGELLVSGERYLDAAAAEELGEELLSAVRAEHRQHPLRDWAELSAVRRRVALDEDLLSMVLGREDRLETAPGGRVRRRGHSAQLSGAQREAREKVLATLREAGASPPPVDTGLTGLSEAETRALLDGMRKAGELVPVGGHLYEAQALEEIRRLVTEHGRSRQGAIDIPALRDDLGTTRKYLIPLLEHLDAEGLTVRHGERRTLRHVDIGS